MSSYDNEAPPPRRRRAWTGVERTLAAFGLSGKALVIAAPASWLTVFFLIPLTVVFGISLTIKHFGRPPYTPLLTNEGGTVQLTLHLDNYINLFAEAQVGQAFVLQLVGGIGAAVALVLLTKAFWEDQRHVATAALAAAALLICWVVYVLYDARLALYIAAYLSSIKIAFFATLITLAIGYPMAYTIARAPDRWRNIFLMLVILPFWTSFLLRVYALSGFMRGNGVINQFLGAIQFQVVLDLWSWIGAHIAGSVNGAWFLITGSTGGMSLAVPALPWQMMQTDFAVYVGIVYTYLPFMILPLYTNLVKLDGVLLEASADLGARPTRTFLSVTLPLSMPGIIAGSMLVFIPAIGEFVIPSLLGGPSTLMIGRVLWDEFFANTNWPRASAVAVAMLVVVVVPIMLLQRAQDAVQDKERAK